MASKIIIGKIVGKYEFYDFKSVDIAYDQFFKFSPLSAFMRVRKRA
jgi:hypothetical protein